MSKLGDKHWTQEQIRQLKDGVKHVCGKSGENGQPEMARWQKPRVSDFGQR